MSTENNKKSLRQKAEDNRQAGFHIDEAEVQRLAREVGPKPGRQQAILDAIDNNINTVLVDAVTKAQLRADATLTDEKGDESLFDPEHYEEALRVALEEGTFLSDREEILINCVGSLSQLLRENWTYK